MATSKNFIGYKTPKAAIQAKLDRWRQYMIAGWVSEHDPEHHNPEYAIPTVKNVTVVPDAAANWTSMAVCFYIENKIAACCIMARALEYGMIGMELEQEFLRERENDAYERGYADCQMHFDCEGDNESHRAT